MTKKTIALATLACFIVFSYSCAVYTWKKTPLDSLDAEKREGLKISKAQTRSGERIEFSKKPPTQIRGDCIIGEMVLKRVEIKKSDIATATKPHDEKSYSFRWGKPKLITTKSGTVYRAVIEIEKKDSLICDAYVAISLPLSDFVSVWQKKPNMVATIIVYALPVAVVAGIIALGIILLLDPMALTWGGWAAI